MSYLIKRVKQKRNVCILAGIALIVLVFALILFLGSKVKYEFPENDDFSLTATVSDILINVGDEINIKGIFRNLTDRSYRLYSGASFSKTGLIHIYIYKQDEEEMVFVGSERIVDIGPNQEVIEEFTQKMTEIGKYKVMVSSNIEIKDPESKEKREYTLKAEKINIQVQ